MAERVSISGSAGQRPERLAKSGRGPYPTSAALYAGLILAAILGPSAPARGGDKPFTLVETKLGKMHMRNPRALACSPDCTKFACLRRVPDGGFVLEVNGKSIFRAFKGLGEKMFLSDGRFIFYAMLQKQPHRGVLVIDGVAHDKEYAGVLAMTEDPASGGTVALSPDGRHYMINLGLPEGEQILLHDGSEHGPHGGIYGPVFSPDSKRWAYTAREGPRYYQVIDGIDQHPFDQMTPDGVTFSPDSKRFAYIGYRGERGSDQKYAVMDNLECGPYDWVSPPVFSPDSRHVACTARREGRSYLVLDGEERQLDRDPTSEAIYTADGKLAYLAWNKAEGCRLVIDGRSCAGRYPVLPMCALRAAPRGSSVAWLTSNKEDTEFRFVVDDKPGPAFPTREGMKIVFSPDGKRHAYRGKPDKNTGVVVVDGVVRPESRGTTVGQPAFSPDSRRVAYLKAGEQTASLVVDGVEGPAWRALAIPGEVFTPDSRHVVYLAGERGRFRVVVDGVGSGEAYSAPFPGSKVFFPGDNQCRFLLVRDDDVFRVDVKLGSGESGDASGQAAMTVGREADRGPTDGKDEPAEDDAAERQCKTWLALAVNYAKAGMREKARQQLRKIIDTYPGTAWSKQARTALQEIAEE